MIHLPLQRATKEHFFAFEFEHQKSKFMWITLRGVSTILFTTCINTAVEEYVLKGNKQQLTMVCIHTVLISVLSAL